MIIHSACIKFSTTESACMHVWYTIPSTNYHAEASQAVHALSIIVVVKLHSDPIQQTHLVSNWPPCRSMLNTVRNQDLPNIHDIVPGFP